MSQAQVRSLQDIRRMLSEGPALFKDLPAHLTAEQRALLKQRYHQWADTWVIPVVDEQIALLQKRMLNLKLHRR